jgi:hypothetical protein
MALEAEILENNYGLPADFAKRFVQFTKGDIEAAISIIEASEKDMTVLKMKFISSKKMVNGAILLFYNFQTNSPEYIFAVVSGDSNLSRIKIENGWKEVYAELEKYMVGSDSDPEYASKIESRILYSENLSYISGFFLDKSTVDLTNIKRFILSEISKVLLDTGIILKLVSEEIDIFRFRNFLAVTKMGLKVVTKNKMEWLTLLNIRIEPVLAPLGGTDIEKTQLGDEVLVKIADNRDIVPFILSFVDPNLFVESSLYGRLVHRNTSQGTENNMVIVEFGPGIYGKFIIGGKIRVQVREKQQKVLEDGTVVATDGTAEHRSFMDQVPKIDEIPQTHADPETILNSYQQGGSSRNKAAKPKNTSIYMFIWFSVAALIVIMLILMMIFG